MDLHDARAIREVSALYAALVVGEATIKRLAFRSVLLERFLVSSVSYTRRQTVMITIGCSSLRQSGAQVTKDDRILYFWAEGG